MGNFTLKGHVSYAAKRKYKWIAEFGENTCEKCQNLAKTRVKNVHH